MELADIRHRLQKLDDSKLIDIVKNYRQYGYNEEIRNYALSLLEQRGISKQELEMTGNLENQQYNLATYFISAFKRNSTIAFILYVLALGLKAVSIWIYPSISDTTSFNILFIVVTIFYLIFLVRSFINHSDFYKSTGENFGLNGALMYLVLGMPFYIIMYFVFHEQMKERAKLIR